MNTDTTTLCKELAAIGKSLRVIGQILETGASVEGKRAANGAYDEEKKTAPAKTTGKKAAAPPADEDDDFKADTGEANGFDDDDDTVAEASFDDAGGEEEEAKPAKKSTKSSNGKAKKITLDDVNDACKAHAAAKGRPATLAVLQNKFKTQSVTALKPEQYETCISAMSVN